MIFHVKHVHSWEACPYHDPERAKATFGKALGGLAAGNGAKLLGGYVDAAAHTTFLLVEADSAVAIEEALSPIIDLGWAETRPVVDAADILRRVTEGG